LCDEVLELVFANTMELNILSGRNAQSAVAARVRQTVECQVLPRSKAPAGIATRTMKQ